MKKTMNRVFALILACIAGAMGFITIQTLMAGDPKSFIGMIITGILLGVIIDNAHKENENRKALARALSR